MAGEGGVHSRGRAWRGGMCGRMCVWWEGACVDRMTDACKNITLPQTSFSGGNRIFAI